MSGADILRVLCEDTSRDGSDPSLEAASHPRRLAFLLYGAGFDGRAVSPTLRRLVEAGLADRGPRSRWLASGKVKSYRGAGNVLYSPTRRGREVDRLVASADPARGGSFQPKAQLSTSEMLALR